ncbi:B-cell CLL/lymphoma 6 member B protein-like isoform X1 [Gadus chalcogrammus]|uniref:B-cell CLL/lymphoma 6 member B protein-like isoform X1 n=1 Tax=Gadus chalcogrammus TaxID=1042646 RepID=UPI0024C4E059|nr:B-cell CLL/lymphoma 6 member B protein-like isoform X1 [Gadus chalcogrammus]
MSTREETAGRWTGGWQEQRAEPMDEAAGEGFVKEYTRHSSDVLQNLNELRRRHLLTDTTLVVGGAHLRAHCAVLVACSGFFYSLYSRRLSLQGGAAGLQPLTVALPGGLDVASVSLLLDFMYTSRLPLSHRSVAGVLAAATHLQMEHVADTCRAFMQLHREQMGAEHPQVELDSRVSVVSVGPRGGGGLPPQTLQLTPSAPGPLPAQAARFPREAGLSVKPGAFPAGEPRPKETKLERRSPLAGCPNPSPDSPTSPTRSGGQPSSPAESNTCHLAGVTKPPPDPKACNWKKYKYIVLNPLCAVPTVKEEEPGERNTPISQRTAVSSDAPTEAWPGEVPGQIDRQGRASCYEGSGQAPPLGPPPSVEVSQGAACSSLPLPPPAPAADHAHPSQRAFKREDGHAPYLYSGNVIGTKALIAAGDKPYRCNVCSAQFNRPANLKTHARIHSGEKPYRCDTCGARFVQVAHLRAHVLIHTGEKPYPCHTCGTRFRHLQTLKSHLRIHTGEKPYTCEQCDLHFRHKSQLRLHLRQKHGAITNTKVRYKVLSEGYQPLLQAC